MKADQLRRIANRVSKERAQKENKRREQEQKEAATEMEECVAEAKASITLELWKRIKKAAHEGESQYKYEITYQFGECPRYKCLAALVAMLRAEITNKGGPEIKLVRDVRIHPARESSWGLGTEEWRESVDILIVSW